MAYVYILYSQKINKFYIGSCKSITERFEQHLNRTFKNAYTKIADDWVIYFHIADLGYMQARLIEKHIKNMKSKIYIQNLKLYPEMVEKLKNKYS